jgi:ketosteroid isomerase-like protein
MLTIIEDFNKAFNLHDVDTMMALMTEDCLFDNTFPPPDGESIRGNAFVKKFWYTFFQNSPKANIEIEEIVVCGERIIQRWVYHWEESNGKKGYVRGVDVILMRDSLIHEKRSYVKG